MSMHIAHTNRFRSVGPLFPSLSSPSCVEWIFAVCCVQINELLGSFLAFYISNRQTSKWLLTLILRTTFIELNPFRWITEIALCMLHIRNESLAQEINRMPIQMTRKMDFFRKRCRELLKLPLSIRCERSNIASIHSSRIVCNAIWNRTLNYRINRTGAPAKKFSQRRKMEKPHARTTNFKRIHQIDAMCNRLLVFFIHFMFCGLLHAFFY